MKTTARARTLRHKQTDAERKLWHHLRSRRLGGYKFRRQHHIGPYFTDFCCPEYLVVIEIDGSQHAKQLQYDAKRTDYFKHLGYDVIRFGADEAVRNTEMVAETILTMLTTRPHPSPLPKGEGK